MSTTAVSAGQIMDRVANLLNDPNKTDYTYKVITPYLNMAIEELSELMEESNSPITNITSLVISIPMNAPVIISQEYPDLTGTLARYPLDLVEIQEIGERQVGSMDRFIRLNKREFPSLLPASNSLLFWTWEQQVIKFNPNGTTAPMEVQLKYINQGVPYIADENATITMINSRSYLSFKTAALCARFIGENETRADVLDRQADKAAERITTISNKGRQQIMTRHRPFRAAYKSRGWV